MAGRVNSLRQLAASVPIRTAGGGAQIAIPILAVQTTGDVALGATLVALALLPSIIAAPLVGALLDGARSPRRLMMIAAAGTAAAYVVASSLGNIPLWVVFVTLGLSGLLNPFGFGGLSSFVVQPGGDVRRAYALDALSYNVSGVTGPAIVAVLAPTLGARAAMVAMAVIALCSLLAYPLLPMHPRESKGPGLLRSMAAGIVAMTMRRRLAMVTVAGTVTEFGRGIMPIAAIGIALQATGDASSSALIVAAFAVGALVGALIETVRRAKAPPPLTMAVGYALTGSATMVAAIGLNFGWTIGFVALSGLLTAAPTAAMLMLRRTQSPDGTVAQVFTVSAALRVAGGAAGTALAGALAGVDPHTLLLASGAVWLLGASAMIFYPRGREPDAGSA